jgi:hypothetical protein
MFNWSSTIPDTDAHNQRVLGKCLTGRVQYLIRMLHVPLFHDPRVSTIINLTNPFNDLNMHREVTIRTTMCYCKRNRQFSVETCFASEKNCNLTLGYFVFNSSIFISVYHFHAQSLIQSTRKRHNY